MNWLVNNFGWMYWTWPSAIFIIAVFGSVAFLCVLSHFKPNVDHKGFLPMETGRGDKLFIGILSTIVIFLLWLGFLGDDFLIITSIISGTWFFSVFKWG